MQSGGAVARRAKRGQGAKTFHESRGLQIALEEGSRFGEDCPPVEKSAPQGRLFLGWK